MEKELSEVLERYDSLCRERRETLNRLADSERRLRELRRTVRCLVAQDTVLPEYRVEEPGQEFPDSDNETDIPDGY